MRAYSIPRRLSTCKGGGITATGGNKKCFEKRKREGRLSPMAARSTVGRYMSNSSSGSAIQEPDRQVLCSGLPVLPVFKDFTKGDKFLRFCHKTCSIPTKKGASETRTSYVRRAASSPTFSGQDRLPKTASERPFVDSTFRFYPQCAQDPS